MREQEDQPCDRTVVPYVLAVNPMFSAPAAPAGWQPTKKNSTAPSGLRTTRAYHSNVVTSDSLTPPKATWDNRGTQQCVHVIDKVYPAHPIRAYNATSFRTTHRPLVTRSSTRWNCR
jgi:hypothetical protein